LGRAPAARETASHAAADAIFVGRRGAVSLGAIGLAVTTTSLFLA